MVIFCMLSVATVVNHSDIVRNKIKREKCLCSATMEVGLPMASDCERAFFSVLMAAKPHREYDSCRASIVTAECCLCTALKYHGLDQIPMAIIRCCGSEPKVNQCLNISFSCPIGKSPPPFTWFTLFGVDQKARTSKPARLLLLVLFFCFFASRLEALPASSLVFLTYSSSFAQEEGGRPRF